MKTLSKEWSDYLRSKPETGMDYQVIAITLRDGRKIEDVAIIGSHSIGEVRGYEGVPFEPEDIVGIELTHNRWKFRR